MKLKISDLFNMPVFPYAREFPLLTEEEEKELAQDIELNGQQHPIIVFESQILDGRNRIRALKRTNLHEADVEYFEGTEFQAVEKVRALNILRRHLTVGQRSAAAYAYLPYEESEAKKRKLATQNNDTGKALAEGADPPDQDKKGRARDIVAEKFNLNGRRIEEYKNLALNAEDLSEEVKAGTKALDRATRELKARKEDREKKLNRLETEGLDLYSQFRQNELTLDEAYVTLMNRHAQAKREAQARSEALYHIQSFARYAENHLQDFNLMIVKLSESEHVDEALSLIYLVENYLEITKNALKLAKTQLEESG